MQAGSSSIRQAAALPLLIAPECSIMGLQGQSDPSLLPVFLALSNMLSLGRALGRAGAQLGARSAASGCGGGTAGLVEAASGSSRRAWYSIFDEYAGRGVSRLAAAPPLTRREEDQSKGRWVHSGGERAVVDTGRSIEGGGDVGCLRQEVAAAC